MSSLMSALDEIEWAIAETRTIQGLDTETERLLDGLARIEVLLAEVVTQLEARQGHEQLGYPSPTAYLMHRGRMSAGRAHRIVADAHARHKAPGAHRAWCNGRLSTDQARRIFAAAAPHAYTTAEKTLVAAIEGLSVSPAHRDNAATTPWKISPAPTSTTEKPPDEEATNPTSWY